MGARVLIVEDSRTVRSLVRAALEAGGHQVSESADGDAALKALETGPVDVIVADVNMPVNIRFMRGFLRNEGLPLVSEDVGGYEARHVYFQTNTGRAWVKRLCSPRAKAELVRTERRITAPVAPPPTYGDVTLF